jgi:hypothetical protein
LREVAVIEDLARVVRLVGELPEQYQKEAAQRLARLFERADEEMTMTEEEIQELRRLERERTDDVWRRLREFVGHRK